MSILKRFWETLNISNQPGNPEPVKENPNPLPAIEEGTISMNWMKTRTIQTIRDWHNSLNSAEVLQDRKALLKVYREAILDPTVKACIDYRDRQLQSIPWELNKIGTDEPDEELTAYFNREWFLKMLSVIQKCKYLGPTALQIDQINKNSIDFTEIPRYLYKPEKGVISYSDVGYSGDKVEGQIFIRTTEPYSEWIMEFLTIEGSENLGLLNPVSPFALWKRLAQQSHAEFAESFGNPWKVMKTTKQKPEEKRILLEMLKKMGKSASIVLDKDLDEIELINPSSPDAYNVFIQLAQSCDNQIEKLLLGSNVLLGNQQATGSYNMSDSHQTEFHKLLKSDMKEIEFWVNGILIPYLVNLNVIKDGYEFKFMVDDSMSPMEYKDVLAVLLPHYDVSIEDIERIYGLDIVGYKNTSGTDLIPENNEMENDEEGV
jgi:hypothetical protein